MVMGRSVIAYFCLNWCMAQLSPRTATLPDSFWAPSPNQTKPEEAFSISRGAPF